jgi:L-seryl-tRNA(Ser) seleniumtransferase
MMLSSLPSVDRLLRRADADVLVRERGRALVTAAIREVLQQVRGELQAGGSADPLSDEEIVLRVRALLDTRGRPSLRRVFNLTGTVLHTNLGRAPLPAEAIAAMLATAQHPMNIEFDLEQGKRGDRDDHVESLIRHLTGAEAATVVNNNAAAVVLVLNTLARRREVVVSRGELIEIGGSFRLPEIMASAGCRLREVGTTNRVHRHDYEAAIDDRTGLVMKVHTSNYAVIGFTASVPERDLAAICRDRRVPFVVDLGSGTLLDLRGYGLPYEPTAAASLRHGADLVTFSGDKVLGGPQAGVIAGRADLVRRIARNPLKRALRVDKMTIAALASVLTLYLDPARLPERLPVLRLLTRRRDEIRGAAQRLVEPVARAVGPVATVAAIDCSSQIGSGALPTTEIPSAGLAIRPTAASGAGRTLNALSSAFRALPIPVIGRIQGDMLMLDLRCLDDEQAFVAQLSRLDLPR